MTREQFIEKWSAFLNGFVQDEFISDLNSLFNLRTEEEVREKLKETELKFNRLQNGHGYKEMQLLKWFLKE